MSIETIGRRGFLRGAFGATLTLPFLPSLARVSHAAGYEAPKRFVFMFSSCGMWPDIWWPSDPPSWTQLDTHVRQAPLVEDGTAISPVIGEHFDRFKSKLLLLRGLDVPVRADEGHNPMVPLSGFNEGNGMGPTIDQVMAQSPAVYPTAPPVRSAHVLIKRRGQVAPEQCSVAGSGNDLSLVQHDLDAPTLYNRLFGTYEPPTEDPLELSRSAIRAGVLDGVREEYDLLMASDKLSQGDKRRLEQHAEMFHDLGARLSTAGPACAPPDPPPDYDNGTDAPLPHMTKDALDVIAAAIKCDRTRVATVMLNPSSDIRQFSTYWDGFPGSHHHGISHGGEEVAPFRAQIQGWYGEQMAYLLEQLDVVEDPETGATFLDNSIVFWGNEDGANKYDAHRQNSMPVLLAGSAGGYLETGRYIDYRHHGTRIYYNNNGGRLPTSADDLGHPYNSLLISLLSAMGVPRPEWENAAGGFGVYTPNINNQYDIEAGKLELPFLRA